MKRTHYWFYELDILPRLKNICKPLLFLSITIPFGLVTIFHLIFAGRFSTLFSWAAFSDEWFACLWLFYGPLSLKKDEKGVKHIVSQARGTVLDLGPGSGSTVHLLPKSQLTKVYGIEPNLKLHSELKENIKKAGLESMYEIIGASAEDMEELCFQHGSFDTILSVKVICSLVSPEKTLRTLYPFLAPGGQWLVFEHVKNTHSFFIAAYQDIIQLFWPHCFGGCNLNRRTGELLMALGDWETGDVKLLEDEKKWEIMPHISGKLIKGAR